MAKGTKYTFRVSDALEVPLRGHMLRLRLLKGEPSMIDLAVGKTLRLESPTGETRDIAIKAHSVTSGMATQKRLDSNGELDIIVDSGVAMAEGRPVEIGWVARGPVEE